MSLLHLFSLLRSPDTVLLIIAGQSNAVGWENGAPSDLHLNGNISNANIYTGSDWETLNYSSNNEGENGHGVELQSGYQGAINEGKNFYIIKHASGSSSLAIDWLAGSGSDYLAMETKVLNGIAAIPETPTKIVFYFNQGEEDSLTEAHALAYEQNLKDLIDQVRSDINSNIVFVQSQLRLDIGRTYMQEVRDGQNAAIESKANAFIINQDDLTKHDTLHFDSDSQNILADRIIDLI